MPDILIQSLQAPLLKQSPNRELFALHRAALEWDIQEPIIIEGPNDIKSEASWRHTLEPFHHQVQNLITFCRRLPVTLLADDVGLGKTISAGLILSELISRKRVTKALIVCPKILMPQWKEELQSKFKIESTYGSGIQEIRRAVDSLKDADHGIFITTYASVRSHMAMLEKSNFQMLILDEAHKLRNLFGTDSAPQVALRMRKTLADRTFKYVLMLTATPIHNRLWDLYSLIDLMTVAKGHQNPFGSEERFARRYITDGSQQARQLNPEHRDEFRGIVYGYMSRVRRADAKLAFPVRKVKLHRVPPTSAELKLIQVVGQEILKLNKLAQISLLKALVSSPQALVSQLKNMAAKGTMPEASVASITDIARQIDVTSKLRGLETLTDQLRRERPSDWRMVVFTQLLETQKAISEYLELKGIRFGIISGESSRRNQETIRRFSTSVPEINVVVSTEAGAEGVNLQVANVLVNYDLPWNPMIVEQRIGRIQRLGSRHANVSIFNAILEGTFEERIVGRLMEKLQMATSAIGDIDSLLEAAGLDSEGDESSFEEMIRGLVVASLAGKDVDEDTCLKVESISQAKLEIEKEESEINTLLGGMDDPLQKGPRAPKISPPKRSFPVREFVMAALKALGQKVLEEPNGVFVVEGTSERIAFEEGVVDDESINPPVYYVPGRPRFDRLVGKFISVDECVVTGLNIQLRGDSDSICQKWVSAFGGEAIRSSHTGTIRKFDGKALLRTRLSIAHDSFEKIIEIDCTSKTHSVDKSGGNEGVVDPSKLGLDSETLIGAALQDPDVKEFSRFYLERRADEMKAAGDDERKRGKLEDDFTPRLEPSLVGLTGDVTSTMEINVRYQINGQGNYSSLLQIDVGTGSVVLEPLFAMCEITTKRVPCDCLGNCQGSGKRVLKHLLIKSEISELYALPEHMVVCGISGKR
ncbi:MAG: DEAD/DEAH box helicase, partial [Elusimicrobia bacterium]|nr:DEAD/DEAH box helicase [Elusimicrobiota bacterium]